MNVVANIDTTPTNHPHLATRKPADDWKVFDVPTEVFTKFETGRNKFERWYKYLNLEDNEQKGIYDYATKNPKNTIILRDSTNGVMRQIRRRSACSK